MEGTLIKKTIKRRTADPSYHTTFTQPIHSVLKRIYAARGIISDTQLEYSLGHLPKPESLRGLEAAVALLTEALQHQERVLIVGDFDADGATSTVLMIKALTAMGLKHVDYLVPNRFEFGYGLTPEIVAVAASLNPQLLITVDNGISSIAGVAAAKAQGIKVLITDHHLPGATLPMADAIVNPNQPECPFPSKNLAGVGVVFYLVSAFRAHLRSIQWFEQAQLREPNMAEFLDLVALGTVADVVPLDHHNRILIAQGLARIRVGKICAGIKALLDISGRNYREIAAADLGFYVGPRLNAAGRLDDMSLGIRCLLCDNEGEALAHAQELHELNQDRKAIEASMKQEAMTQLQELDLTSTASTVAGLCLYQPGWHQGVVGILASRVKDLLHRPVIVFADTETDQLKGSGRSIPGLHLRDILDEVASQTPGLLCKFGGHAMAAGLTIERDHFSEFERAFNDVVQRHFGHSNPVAEILTDGELAREELTLELAAAIHQGGPWGQGFPEPQFDGQFKIIQQRIVGGNHLKMVVAPCTDKTFELDAIAFNIDTSLWPNSNADYVNLIYQLDVNSYRGQQTLQLLVKHIEL